MDDNDRLAAIQEDQTAQNPGKVLVRYGSRDKRTLTPSRALWMSVSFKRLVYYSGFSIVISELGTLEQLRVDAQSLAFGRSFRR